ncbi:MAG: hypothetical protein ACTHJM_03015 [Marmoricola sp.]
MSNVQTSFRFWNRGNHRHHHSFDAGNEVPGLATAVAYSTTYLSTSASDTPGATFCFWSESGGLDRGLTSTSPQMAEAYPAGDTAATLTAWYLPRVDDPGQIGVGFDAFSAESGDFLDWGDTFNPFTVDPADAVHADDDSFVHTDAGAAHLNAAVVWPGDGRLLFSHWVCFGAPGDGTHGQLDLPQGASGACLAVYAPVDGPPDPSRKPWPPKILVQGDPAQIASEVLGSPAFVQQAKGVK